MIEGFGIMDQTYFLGRQDILKWINDLLQTNVEKVENLGNCAEYCQLLNIIYPNEINVKRVKRNSKLPWEILSNWKILQQVLTKHHIRKNIDVQKLSMCRYQDNLEFAQWQIINNFINQLRFKKFFENSMSSQQSKQKDEQKNKEVIKNIIPQSTYKVLQPRAIQIDDLNIKRKNCLLKKVDNNEQIIKKIKIIMSDTCENEQKISQIMSVLDIEIQQENKINYRTPKQEKKIVLKTPQQENQYTLKTPQTNKTHTTIEQEIEQELEQLEGLLSY